MGEVFRARDTTLDRDVAIKVPPAALATDTEHLVRFKQEAQILASLSHSNIAHGCGLEGATLPMVPPSTSWRWHTYHVSMKNVTLALDEATLRDARRIAAERSTSLNALSRDFLDRLTTTESRTR